MLLIIINLKKRFTIFFKTTYIEIFTPNILLSSSENVLTKNKGEYGLWRNKRSLVHNDITIDKVTFVSSIGMINFLVYREHVFPNY